MYFPEAFEAYQVHGGQLSQHNFDLATEYLFDGCPEFRSDDSYEQSAIKNGLIQARQMARLTGVGLTEDEGWLYAWLRNQPRDNCQSGLSDQELLAEVFIITDSSKVELFKSKYPNIFH